jgi:hypothetical protein
MTPSEQSYSRWFVEWPVTHVRAGKTVEVTPVAPVDALRARLRRSDWIVCAEALDILDVLGADCSS